MCELLGNTVPRQCPALGRGARAVPTPDLGLRIGAESGPLAQPRMLHTSRTPRTAEITPAIRNETSGVSKAFAASRLAARGNAAKIKPSMASTRPIATMKSDMALRLRSAPRASEAGRLAQLRLSRPAPTRHSVVYRWRP